MQDSGEAGTRQVLFEPRPFAAFAHDEEAVILGAGQSQPGFHLLQQADVFFGSQPAHESENHAGVCARPLCGIEQRRVDAPAHEPHGPSGACFQHVDQLRIWREDQLRHAVEARRQRQHFPFHPRGQAGQPAQTARGVLMDVGMPGGHQRNLKVVGGQRPEDAAVARSGDVDDVRAKLAERLAHPPAQAEQGEVE